MEKIYWYKIAINLSILISLLLIYLGLKFLVQPSLNAGFYCNDYSVSQPFRPSTVNESWLHVISIVLPFLFMLATETVRSVYAQIRGSINNYNRNKYKILLPFAKELHLREQIGNMFVNYEYFLFGLAVNADLTLLVKVVVGRLRPNFLAVCNPKEDPYTALCRNGKTFLIPGTDFQCSSTVNLSELTESRRSFPSGHSSSIFYTMIFLILYINKVWHKRDIGLLAQFVQVIFVGVAIFVALSRILDNMHHPTDVLSGTMLGIIVSIFTFYYLELFYRRHNYIGKYELTKINYQLDELDEFEDNYKMPTTMNDSSQEIKYDL